MKSCSSAWGWGQRENQLSRWHLGEGTPRAFGQGTARRDHGLWGRCLTPDTLVSDDTTTPRRSLLLTLGCCLPLQHQLGTGHLQHQDRLQGTPLCPAQGAGRVGRALHRAALSPAGGSNPTANQGARGAAKREAAPAAHPGQQSHLPTAQAEALQGRDGPGKGTASRDRVHTEEPSLSKQPLKTTLLDSACPLPLHTSQCEPPMTLLTA